MSNDLETGLLDHSVKREVLVSGGGDVLQYLRFCFSLFRTLQPDDERNVYVKLLGSVDDTLGDVITSHDT